MSDAQNLRTKAHELIEAMHAIANIYPSRMNSDSFHSLYEILKVVNKSLHEDFFAIINTLKNDQQQIEYVCHSKDISVRFDSKNRKDYVSIKQQEQVFTYQDAMFDKFEGFYTKNTQAHLLLMDKGLAIAKRTFNYLENLSLSAMGTRQDPANYINKVLPYMNEEAKIAMLTFGLPENVNIIAPAIIHDLNRSVDFVNEAKEYYQKSWRQILIKRTKNKKNQSSRNRYHGYYSEPYTLRETTNEQEVDKVFNSLLSRQQEQIQSTVNAASLYHTLNNKMNTAKVVKKMKI